MKNVVSSRIVCFALLVSLAIASPSIAMGSSIDHGTSYGGVHFSQLAYDEDGVSNDANPTLLTGRLGHFFANQVAIEGRLGLGLSDDTVRIDDFGLAVDVDMELDRLFGVYAVGHFPLGQSASIYGLFGFTDAKATFSTNGFSDSDTDSGFSYGFGVDIYSSDQFGLNIEYTQYLDESGYDLSALSLGVKFIY
ncbi:opacity protein-like surface antigen [Natronospira proteinivora]|uniref:Opacity protein-like surface antigen n=1 Tax=Natronospira proteinivora TaxID=1807133 RepID=A0ABT1GBV8_9GAMM|nr:porin family protein [Natronospira proteinivora]MCP1727417.1 opacity protein-like surface antigen [Natronospira proteinivora]